MEELLKEALHEITAEPVIFMVELVQFAILAGVILWAIPRFTKNRLKERREKIATELAEAAQADREYSELKKQAEAIVSAAEEEARRIIKETKASIKKEHQEALVQIDEEIKEILNKAEQAVNNEKNQVVSEASEQLVILVSEVSRRFLDEALSESERRELTHKMILDSLKEMESASLL